MTTYNITGMRVTFPTGATAEKNPERFATVYGVFHTSDGTKLSFTSKEITIDLARNPETVIDAANGILTIPTGKRGRVASVGESQSDIEKALASLRK